MGLGCDSIPVYSSTRTHTIARRPAILIAKSGATSSGSYAAIHRGGVSKCFGSHHSFSGFCFLAKEFLPRQSNRARILVQFATATGQRITPIRRADGFRSIRLTFSQVRFHNSTHIRVVRGPLPAAPDALRRRRVIDSRFLPDRGANHLTTSTTLASPSPRCLGPRPAFGDLGKLR